jgi:hypothetical protein
MSTGIAATTISNIGIFFAYNDLTQSTVNQTWHEGDWEHVSLKIQDSGGVYEPVAVNFYQHGGGHTKTPSETWWSPTNSNTYLNIQQGYDENHTHLHIWIAANSHASYNRHDKVYDIQVDVALGLGEERFTDNCDYEPSTLFDLYFAYDYLEKLGEISSETDASRHGYTWLEHTDPVRSSKEWLAFVGRWGEYWWSQTLAGYPVHSFSPVSPAYTDPEAPNAHEWKSFSIDYTPDGFGNDDFVSKLVFFSVANGTISWVDDPPGGDGN